MIIRLTTDEEEIRKIICDDDIYPKIAGKNPPNPDDFDFNALDGEYLAGYIDSDIMGLMVFELIGEWTCHFQVLKEYRKEYADEFATKSLDWFWRNHSVDLLTASIGNEHENVLNFAYKHGFKAVSAGVDTKLELRR